jgi:very-short-patch-repair endonuclease
MSPPESRVRIACRLAGLPHPVPQFQVVEDGAFLGQVDLAWPEARLIVEYEGEYHFDELQIRRDDARYARLVAAGWRVIRLSSVDLRNLEKVVQRIREALALGAVAG